jgi:hypothetical protein
MYETTQSEYANESKKIFTGFLSTVTKVFTDEESMSEFPLNTSNDAIKVYNGNKNFNKTDTKFLGAIELSFETAFKIPARAYPFDKNTITYPIVGETVFVIQIDNKYFWLPYSNTIYPNYREAYSISELTKERKELNSSQNKDEYSGVKKTGIVNSKPVEPSSKKSQYEIKDKVKFLKPKTGDTIIMGRVGQSIRFSEFFLTEDGKSSSPSIFISNKKSIESENTKIGELIEEDINIDGSSIYIVSEKVKVPFDYKNVSKERIAFKDFPKDDSFQGNQVYINSDQIILSAKSKEFIVFGKGNTGIITDANFSVDAKKEVYIHNESNITLHTKGSNQIFLNSENGKIYLGKNKGEGAAGADVQKMVLGGELVKILQDLIDEVTKMWFLTPAGGSKKQPQNFPQFQAIKNRLDVILSKSNYLSK